MIAAPGCLTSRAKKTKNFTKITPHVIIIIKIQVKLNER